MINSKKAAMEMSVGTIVTIVLGVTLLVGGIFFIQKIVSSATGVADLTDEQLRNEINQLFSDEDEVVIYPGTRYLEIKQDNDDGIGFGIKNLGTKEDEYSYSLKATTGSNCPDTLTEEEALSWVILGGSEENIALESGGFMYRKISFEIPIGAPLCTVRYSISITSANGRKLSDAFDIKVKAK